jgi:CHAT domain-containing protein/predicted negative regulator of RcsB-dependent stress response
MDAQSFVAGLLPLRGAEVERFIAEHATEVDDLDAAVELLSQQAKEQEGRDLELLMIYANHLLAVACRTGKPRHHALGALALGNGFLLQGQHQQAITYLDEAGADFLAVGDEVGWARTRISHLWSASQIGKTEQALEQAEQARAIFIQHGEDKRAADMDIAIAIALDGLGRYQEALAIYDRALITYLPSDPKQASHHRALVLVNKAVVLQMLGDFHNAIACEQEARSIFVQHEEYHRVAWIDHNLGANRANLGQYSAALQYYYQALDYYQRHPALLNWVALCTSNIADCLLRLNRVSEARQLALEAITIYRTLDEKTNLGWALIRLARVQTACNEIEAALHILQEAREQFENISAVATTGLVSLALAELLLLSNQPAQALTNIKDALDIFSAHQMEAWIAEAHLLQGRVFEASGDLDQAELLGERARQEAHQADLPWLEFGCEHLLGRLAERKGDLNNAERHYTAALNLLEGLMTWLVRDQRSTFLADKESVFNALISLSLHHHDANTALEYLERLKSQVLREYLTRSAEIRLKASTPDEARLLEELQRLREELHGYSSQIAALEKTLEIEQGQAVRGGQSSAAIEQMPQHTLLEQQKTEQRKREQAIRDLLERAFLEHERSRFNLLASAETRHGAHAARAPVLIEHLAELLPADCTLLEYFPLGNDLLIFTLHAHHRRAEVTRVPGAVARLSKLLPLFRFTLDLVAHQPGALSNETPLDAVLTANTHRLTRQLYDLLLRPIEQHIPPDGRLLIVPYGSLHTLPFHALQSEAGYLIERCEVVYLPAAAMLSLQEANRLKAKTAIDERRQALILGHSYGEKIPHALREARQLAALLDGDCYLEEEATIERLSHANDRYAIIHVAAHGKNRADAPDFSYLQLADGQLSMVDVFNLDLPAELVTLSGCETGLVTIGAGDELLGLGRGFLYAGARSLVMSLWQVEDASTAQLMERFYQELLGGKSRAGALRAAQRALLASAREGRSPAAWAHPYFWASFRLLGESGSVAL